MAHAKVFVFADYYGISDLMDLALDKLGHMLIELSAEATPADILPLLRYCYDMPEKPEQLRAFVVLYAACEAKTLWQCEEFQELVAENRELSLVFMNQVMEKVPEQPWHA